MKYLGMVHIGKPDCVAIHNLEAILQYFSLYKFTRREIIYNANEPNKFKATWSNHHLQPHTLELQQVCVPTDEAQLLNMSII